MMNTTIRMLGPDDATAYRAVRRRALIEHPEAFSGTLQEFEQRTLEEIAIMLATPTPQRCTFGAFVEQQMVGLAAYGRPDNDKLRHRAGLYQMYVAPECRGMGLGRQLVDAVIEHAARQDGLEELYLNVTVGNVRAELLYRRCGFEPKFVDSHHMKIDDTYYDVLWMGLPLQRWGQPSNNVRRAQ
jgi:RimJ/RimL family protein N-acetyltransferase